MAHECPTCYMNCHCGGDIDDICFSGTKEEMMCTHCDEDDEDPDYDEIDEMNERNPFFD